MKLLIEKQGDLVVIEIKDPIRFGFTSKEIGALITVLETAVKESGFKFQAEIIGSFHTT